eukprot:scaffold24023_cov32-Attheya_sp.AAC.1
MGPFDAGSFCSSNAGRLFRNGWLDVEMMHLKRQSTRIHMNYYNNQQDRSAHGFGRHGDNNASIIDEPHVLMVFV